MQVQTKQNTLNGFPNSHSASSPTTSTNDFVALGQGLARAIPNRIVLAIVLIGCLAESVALSQIQQPLVTTGWRVALLTPLFLFWFWLTVGLYLHKTSIKLLRTKANGSLTKTCIAYSGCFLAFGALVGLYATSWGLFLKTSRFANWEVLRFSFQNVAELTKYVTAAEPVHLLYGCVVLLVAMACLWLLLKPLSHLQHPAAACPLPLNRLWFLATTLMVAAFALIQQHPSGDLALRHKISLKHGLNPVVTLLSTAVDSVQLEPIEQVFERPAAELLPLTTPWAATKAKDRPSIIMIQVESLRSDVVHATHQGQEVMPHLNQLAKESLVWKNAYSQSTHSDYADPCIVSSLYPLRTRTHHYYALDDPWPKQLSYDCLKEAGYATATISSQNEMWGRMEHFLDSPNLDFFYHPERAADVSFSETSAQDTGFHHLIESGVLKAGKFPDRHTTDVAINCIKQTAKTMRPFLLNMNLQSSHFPYIIPSSASKPFQPCEIPANASFAWYAPKTRKWSEMPTTTRCVKLIRSWDG